MELGTAAGTGGAHRHCAGYTISKTVRGEVWRTPGHAPSPSGEGECPIRADRSETAPAAQRRGSGSRGGASRGPRLVADAWPARHWINLRARFFAFTGELEDARLTLLRPWRGLPRLLTSTAAGRLLTTGYRCLPGPMRGGRARPGRRVKVVSSSLPGLSGGASLTAARGSFEPGPLRLIRRVTGGCCST